MVLVTGVEVGDVSAAPKAVKGNINVCFHLSVDGAAGDSGVPGLTLSLQEVDVGVDLAVQGIVAEETV